MRIDRHRIRRANDQAHSEGLDPEFAVNNAINQIDSALIPVRISWVMLWAGFSPRSL